MYYIPGSASAVGSGVFPVGVFLPVDFLLGDDLPDCGVLRPVDPAALPDFAVDFLEPAAEAFFSASAMFISAGASYECYREANIRQ